MADCSKCGASITFDDRDAVVCTFCGAETLRPARAIPVTVVNKIVQVARADEVTELRCPHCRQRLVGGAAGGAELHGCSGCGGIWIDNASARKVLSQPDSVFDELSTRAAANARHRGRRSRQPTCAACPAVLDQVKSTRRLRSYRRDEIPLRPRGTYRLGRFRFTKALGCTSNCGTAIRKTQRELQTATTTSRHSHSVRLSLGRHSRPREP